MAFLDDIPEWVWWAASGASILMFVGTLLLLRVVIVRVAPDHFVRQNQRDTWLGRRPHMRLIARVLRNGVGLLLLASGAIMLLTPGQGLLLILIGASLLDLPGKRELVRRIVRRPAIKHAIDSIRARHGRPPIEA